MSWAVALPIVVGLASALTLWLSRTQDERSAKKKLTLPAPRAWSELTDARYEMTLPMTLAEAEPVSNVLDHLPQLMAEHVGGDAKLKGILTIEPGTYTVKVECIARFRKHKEPFR